MPEEGSFAAGIRADIAPVEDTVRAADTALAADIGPVDTAALVAGTVVDTAAFAGIVAAGDIVVADTAVADIAAVAAVVAADTDSDPAQSWELL